MSDTAAALNAWYAAHARALPWRRPPGAPMPADRAWPYRVWLSEIMLQQTNVVTAAPYFAKFVARWPDVAALAGAEDGEVMQAWAGLGYYARARNLLACARAVVAAHSGRFPAEEARLRTLPGIGAYTAAAIAAFAFGHRALIIDGNVERVVTRLFAIATPLPARAEILAALEAITPAVSADHAPADFAQGLMDLARALCTPREPKCLACPIAGQCRAAAAGNPQDYPVKPAKAARPLRHGIAWWIEVAGEVLTVVRPARGLLGGMRALPTSEWAAAPRETTIVTPANAGAHLPQLQEMGSRIRGTDEDFEGAPLPGDWRSLGAIGHGFTHFELQLAVHALKLPTRPALAGDWLPVHQAADAMPTVFAKAVALAIAQRGQT